MASFESIFPTFLQACADLHNLLEMVTFLLFVTGTVLFVLQGFSAQTAALHFVRLLVLTSLLVFLPQWGNQAQDILQSSIISGLGVDPSNVQDQYNAMLVVKRGADTQPSWWDILGDARGFTVEILISGVLWLVGHFASLLLWWAYVFQKVILYTGYALSPLLIGFMAVPALRSVGGRYLLHITGVLLWPLGWGVAALISQGILDFMTDQSFNSVDPTATLYSLQSSLGVVVLAFWILFSTVAAPLVIQKVLTDGALAGAQLVSGAVGGFIQTAASTAGAAAVASTAGLPLLTAGAAGMAGILSTLSTAGGHGSAGAIIIAGSGLPPRGARGRAGDDLSGDKAVRDLISKSKNLPF